MENRMRKAVPADVDVVVPLLLVAMADILPVLISAETEEETISFLREFYLTIGNQYSYDHILLLTNGDDVLAAANVYDGAQLDYLQEPLKAYLANKGKTLEHIVPEASAGEWYIDTISVQHSYRGQGLGKQFIRLLQNYFKELSPNVMGLLVDIENAAARKLYQTVGFKEVGEKYLGGVRLLHLQCSLNENNRIAE